MSKLFILGSGFSKSVSFFMPTICELASYVKENVERLPGNQSLYNKLVNDPESFLTYLFQPMPWKTEEESFLDRAAFLSLTNLITEYITDCEEKSFKNEIPDWANRFINYLHKNKCVIATLNYDTIIERLSRKLKPLEDPKKERIDTSNYYRMPLASIMGRANFLWGISWYNTYHLLKLHGSINWYFSGDENFNGQQVYYVPIYSDSPKTDINGDFTKSSLIDLVPLIIPL